MKDAQILLVDDLPEWREMIGGLLTDTGYNCITAASVKEAIHILSAQHIALAILDIRLNEADPYDKGGVEIFRWMSKNCSDSKVIMLTGHADIQTVKEVLRYPTICVDFLEKFEIEKLLPSIQRIIPP